MKREARSTKRTSPKALKTESAAQRAFEAFPVLREIGRIGEALPPRSWDELPRHLSPNIDHYVHGLSRRWKKLEGAGIVTTEEVLSEFLAAVARYDRHIRQAAVKAVEAALRVSDQVQVIAQ